MISPSWRRATSLFILGLLLTTACPNMAMSETPEQPVIGRPAFRLMRDDRYGYSINPDARPDPLRITGRIVAVNGIYLKGKSEQEIKQLLEGPVGTSINITVFEEEEFRDFNVTREPLRRFSDPPMADLTDIFEGLDHEIVRCDFRHTSDWLVKENLDVCALANQAGVLEAAEKLPGDNNKVVAAKSAEAAIVSDQLGSFTNAGRFLNIVLQLPPFESEFGNWDPNLSERLILNLQATGRLSEAAKYCQAMIESARAKEFSPPDEFKKKRNLSSTSILFARILLAQGKTKEALAVMTAIYEPAPDKPLDPAVAQFTNTTVELAKFFEKAGDNARAIKCYEQALNN